MKDALYQLRIRLRQNGEAADNLAQIPAGIPPVWVDVRR